MANIDPADFADTCLTWALQFGINAHYLAAVAMQRSKLKDDVVNNQFGPYGWTQAEWNANPERTSPALGGPFAVEDIKNWRAQVTVFALMALRDFTTLQATLGQNPSAIQLYQKQWPAATDPPLAKDLQKACDDTKQSILDAIDAQLPDPAAAAAPIADVKQPVATQSASPGGDQTGGDVTQGRAPPRPQSARGSGGPAAPSANSMHLSGKMSTFGGPNDTGVGPGEGLALYDAPDGSNLFLPSQPAGTSGLARRLNPDAFYVACRWDFALTPRGYLRTIKVKVGNGTKSIDAAPVDWGPNASTGRAADLSPGLAKALGLRTDDTCSIEIPLPQAAAKVAAATAGPTAFTTQVDDTATQQWKFFGGQTYDIDGHAIVHGHKEGEDGWYQRVGAYWLVGTNTRGVDGRNHDLPWSAAFISWVMKTSGAGNRFRYSTQHSVYIFQAIRDLQQNNTAAGFWGWRLNEIKPKIGDVVCWSRQSGIDYDHQNGGDYKGHCDIVVEVDANRVYVIGGNVGDSVTRRPLPLDSLGFLLPTAVSGEAIFALMENRISQGVTS